MNIASLVWPILLLPVAIATAQNPPAPPGKPDDAAALEEAIRAVDDAAKKNAAATKPSEKATPAGNPAKPAEPAKPAPVTPKDRVTPKPVASKSPAPTQTQITGLEDGVLDNTKNTITFRKNVVVDRPDLKIWCDQLEIALNRGPTKPTAKANPKATPKSEDPAKSEEDSDAFGPESIKTATATSSEGGMVVIWRKTETGDVVAIGRQAVYAAKDGVFTITGVPEVLREMTIHASSPGESDKLVMYKNGSATIGKKNDLNLSMVRAKEIRQRMFSHVPGRRPPEASAPSGQAPAPGAAPPPAPALPAPPKPTDSRN